MTPIYLAYLAHGHCFLWQPNLVWLHALSDLTIAVSYYLIPIRLIGLYTGQRQERFVWFYLLFAIYITACGTTHVAYVWNVWHSNYWIEGWIKVITAAASFPTAIAFWILAPRGLELYRQKQALEAKAAAALEELEEARLILEMRVHELEQGGPNDPEPLKEALGLIQSIKDRS